MTDETFLARFLPRFPEWQQRPGETDAAAICSLAQELRLADRIEVFRDYDRVRQAYEAGEGVLVFTERVPEQVEKITTAARPYATLLVAMNADAFTLWSPFPSGQSDNLPAAARLWWDRWLATAFVLYRPAALH
jgi:hypothetical protein